MKRKYTYKGTDGNGGFIFGTTHGEYGTMGEALDEINKRVHTCLKLETESPSSSCSLPKEFDGEFYGCSSPIGDIYIKTKCGDTKALDVRGWGYLTGTGGLHMDDEKACAVQDQFEAWVIEALNAHRENTNGE